MLYIGSGDISLPFRNHQISRNRECLLLGVSLSKPFASPHILELIQCLILQALDLLGFISIMCAEGIAFSHYYSRVAWFNTVSVGGFWYSGIVLFLYIAHLPEKMTVMPWKKAEFIISTLWTFFYLIAAALAAGSGNSGFPGVEAFSAAAVSTLFV